VQVANTRGAGRAQRIQASVAAAVACHLCPHVTPEFGVQILSTPFKPIGQRESTGTSRARAEVLTDDPTWRQDVFEWIASYWAAHGHGPTWGELRQEPSLWPDELPQHVRRFAIVLLGQGRYLDGTKTPFGLKARANDASAPPATANGHSRPRSNEVRS